MSKFKASDDGKGFCAVCGYHGDTHSVNDECPKQAGVKYWLCCGSLDFCVHHSGNQCADVLPQHRHFGTAAEHRARQTPSAPIDRALEARADMVNHPPHYADGKVECIDALEAATKDLTGLDAVCTANAIKYLWRWKKKNGHEDLRKARWYINKLLGDTP